MANNVSNVTAGKPKIQGAMYYAPIGTALPKNATEALDAAFKSVGYVSEDGLTNSNSRENAEIKAWGGDSVLTTQTEKTDTYKFKLLEVLSTDVMKLQYGDGNVSGALNTGITVKTNATELEEHSWVIDMVMRGALERIVIPCAKVTELGDVVYSDGDAVGYDLTLSAFPDENGDTSIRYIVEA